MNNNECNVARDLMPLVIDQVASEDSRTLVETHVKACEPCAQVYTDMQAKTPEKKDVAEDVSFAAAMRQLRRTVGWKRIKVIVFCTIIIPAMLVVGYLGYVFFAVEHHRDMPFDWYNVNLSRTKDGIVLVSMNSPEGYVHGFNTNMGSFNPSIYYISADCPIIPQKSKRNVEVPEYVSFIDLRWKDGKCQEIDYEDENIGYPIKEIRKGTVSNYEVLYQEGDDIPFCPQALEDYVQVEKASDEYFGGFLWFPVSLVPEWK